jgi:hypothetical protein
MQEFLKSLIIALQELTFPSSARESKQEALVDWFVPNTSPALTDTKQLQVGAATHRPSSLSSALLCSCHLPIMSTDESITPTIQSFSLKIHRML